MWSGAVEPLPDLPADHLQLHRLDVPAELLDHAVAALHPDPAQVVDQLAAASSSKSTPASRAGRVTASSAASTVSRSSR